MVALDVSSRPRVICPEAASLMESGKERGRHRARPVVDQPRRGDFKCVESFWRCWLPRASGSSAAQAYRLRRSTARPSATRLMPRAQSRRYSTGGGALAAGAGVAMAAAATGGGAAVAATGAGGGGGAAGGPGGVGAAAAIAAGAIGAGAAAAVGKRSALKISGRSRKRPASEQP